MSEEPTFGQGSLEEAKGKVWAKSCNALGPVFEYLFFLLWKTESWSLRGHSESNRVSQVSGLDLEPVLFRLFRGHRLGNLIPCKLLQTAPVSKVTSLPLYLLYLIFIFWNLEDWTTLICCLFLVNILYVLHITLVSASFFFVVFSQLQC